MGQAPSGESYNTEGDGLPLIAGAGDFGEIYPIAKKFTTEASKVCDAGDIVLGIRATIGEKVLADARYCLGRGVAGLRPGNRLEERFLWHWLGHINPLLVSKARGATFLQVNRSDICELPINLPPLPEQRRIAAILDKADALRTKRREALAQLDRLAQAIFVEMFGDPVTNPKGWQKKKICDLGSVVTGNTPSRAVAGNYGDAIEWIKSDNINTPHYYLTRASECLSESGRKKARTAPPESILVTCIAGSPDCIGNSAMTDREVAFNQQINAFIPRVGNPHFHYAQFVVGKKLIQQASTDGMKGMVSKGKFEQIEVLHPPEHLQDVFSGRALAILAMTRRGLQAASQVDKLFASLQHRAFRGEL